MVTRLSDPYLVSGTVTAQVAGTVTAVVAPNALAFKAPAAVMVSTTGNGLATADAARKYLVVVNDGDSAIYLAIGAAPLLNTGIRINASGGVFEMIAGQNLSTQAVSAICGITARATVQEAT